MQVYDMGKEITFGFDIKIKGLEAVKQQLASLSQAQMGRAIVMAINKTVDKGRAEATRAITDRYAIAASDVRNSVTLSPASAAQGRLQGTISIFGSTKKQGRSLNMIHFVEGKSIPKAGLRNRKGKLNQKREQLRFNIIKGAGGKKISGAFIGNDGRTVFMRTGIERLPIEPVKVIGVSQMFNFKPIRERVIKRITEEFNVELNRAIAQKLRSAT